MEQAQLNNYIIKPKDREQRYHTLQSDINLIMCEIVRLSRLPYSSWGNKSKIQSLDKQVEYMESILASYEKDQKGFE